MKKHLYISFIAIILLFASCTTLEKDTQYPELTGEVVSISKYGNSYLSIDAQEAENAGYETGDIILLKVNEMEIAMPIGTNYSDVDNGSYLAIFDYQNDVVEVAINHGNFAERTGSIIGSEISLSIEEKGGYLDEYMIRHLEKSENREDYSSDEIFANFREVSQGDIKPNRLYRGANPLYGDNRAIYAENLIKEKDIKTIINLADSEISLKEHIDQAPYYKSLYEDGSVILLDMGVDFYSPIFIEKLHEALVFLSENEAPYYIHCNEGKDRAGYVLAIIEALTGSTRDEIIKDYMISFENYFGVKKGSEQYKAISKIAEGFLDSLNNGISPKDSELSQCARNYLTTTVKLTNSQVDKIIDNLTK